jgi:hypothetical protein
MMGQFYAEALNLLGSAVFHSQSEGLQAIGGCIAQSSGYAIIPANPMI